jgi:AcrR family transcriptional regulator
MATREALLDVTARLYAELGWRGTTTRRIAEAAGVNEVTLFRQFGSKELLLNEAIEAAVSDPGTPLPMVPGAMHEELVSWSLERHARIQAKSGIIRASLAEWGERPALAPQACSGGAIAFLAVQQYLTTARALGMIGPAGSVDAAALMLINVVFMDAMTRDALPSAHSFSAIDAISLSVDLVLRGLAAKEIE